MMKLLEASVTADEEPCEVSGPAARLQDAKEGGVDQKGETMAKLRDSVAGWQLFPEFG